MNDYLDPSHADAIRDSGYTIVPNALETDLLEELSAAIEEVREGPGVRTRDGVYAIRNLIRLAPDVRKALDAPVVSALARSTLGEHAFLVRGLFFDRVPRTGWKAPWHQDATVPVRERGDATGFGSWTKKAGVVYANAPPGVLAGMLSIRLYLDDCDDQHGALKVVPMSHNFGRLPVDSIPQFTSSEVEVCRVPRGGALAMKPLLLRASLPASEQRPGRVIHFDFAHRPLPQPLEWHETYRW